MFQIAPGKLFGEALWRLCVCCVVQPSSVGFNMGDVEVIMNLPKEVGRWVGGLMGWMYVHLCDWNGW